MSDANCARFQHKTKAEETQPHDLPSGLIFDSHIGEYYTSAEIAVFGGLEYIVRLPGPMNILQLDELFRAAGPEDALDYLWGRLQDRDLAPDEALALLSAVHYELSAAPASEPKVYLGYARFMESLSREMPIVHDYVVAHWIENRRAARRQPKQGGEAPASPGEVDQASLQPRASVSAGTVAAPGMIPIDGGSNEPAEPEVAPEAGGNAVEKPNETEGEWPASEESKPLGPGDATEGEGDEPSPDD